MRILALSVTIFVLLAANVVAFATLVPLQPSRIADYLAGMAVATLLPPALVAALLWTRRRLRSPRALLAGVAAGLVASLVLTAASAALLPAEPPSPFGAWDAAAKRAHLSERCETRCRHAGTRAQVCEDMCSCTMDTLFATHSDEELMQLTVEGPYGSLSRETNQLLGELAAVCAGKVREADVRSTAAP